MRIERGEGGALVVQWSRASSLLGMVTMGVALATLLAALLLTQIPGLGETTVIVSTVGGAVVAALVVVRRAMNTTWRIGNGAITREPVWPRSGRHWTIDREAEVVLAHRVTSGRNAHEKWGLVVRSGGEEIFFGQKANAEAEARQIGEAVARELRIPLRYGPGGVAIRAEDLDLPFVERVAKYPALRVEPRPRPQGTGVTEEILGSARVFRWRALNPFTLITVLALGVFLLLYVVTDSTDAARILLDHPEWAAGLLAVPLVFLAGVGFRLSAGPQGVEYQITMYGVPVRTRVITAADLEEVRMRKVVHTPVLQLASDREIVRCRLYRWKSDEALEWLAAEVQQALAGTIGVSRFTA